MAGKYKQARYVYCARRETEQDWILYNFLDCRFLRLTDFQKAVYDSAPFDDVSNPFLARLAKIGFLTCEDEYEKLRKRQLQRQKEDRLVKLTICPTMSCNFSCAYCIETGQLRPGRMTGETQKQTLSFAERLLRESQAGHLAVIWFGGEPMLEMGVIQSLSEGLIALADALGIPYTAVIYTNGYFLTEENIRLLEECRVNTVRISVDGSQESHDRMRFLAGGQGTYRRILENLRIPTTMTYRIRCNMTRENLSDFAVLEKELCAIRAESGNTIYLTSERMRVEKEVSAKLHDIELPYPEYYAFYQKVRKNSLSEEDRRYYDFLVGKDILCSAARPYAFCIDERGNLYKCNWFIGKEEHIIGHVGTFRDYAELAGQEETRAFLGNQLAQREKCRNCVMLPACLGRCPLSWELEGKYDCNRAIDSLQELIPEAYKWYLASYGAK